MRVYANMDSTLQLADVGRYVARVERLGFDGVFVPETVHDSFMVATLAVEHSSTLEVGTAITVAFPRSPLVTAYAAWDLQRFSGGRFSLGLGPQVKGNIVGRYATPWTPPVQRMHDYVTSLRALWAAFQNGEPLDHDTDNYRFDRLQPIFNPGPIERPGIPVLLGGVNTAMCRLAGEVADGLITHPTNSNPVYLTEMLLPAVREGAVATHRDPAAVAVTPMVPLVGGRTDRDVARNLAVYRRMFATLYSTPAYHASLRLLGMEDLGTALHAASRRGEWERMPDMLDDRLLDLACPHALYGDLADLLIERYAPLTDRLMLMLPADDEDDDDIAAVVRRLGTPS